MKASFLDKILRTSDTLSSVEGGPPNEVEGWGEVEAAAGEISRPSSPPHSSPTDNICQEEGSQASILSSATRTPHGPPTPSTPPASAMRVLLVLMEACMMESDNTSVEMLSQQARPNALISDISHVGTVPSQQELQRNEEVEGMSSSDSDHRVEGYDARVRTALYRVASWLGVQSRQVAGLERWRAASGGLPTSLADDDSHPEGASVAIQQRDSTQLTSMAAGDTPAVTKYESWEEISSADDDEIEAAGVVERSERFAEDEQEGSRICAAACGEATSVPGEIPQEEVEYEEPRRVFGHKGLRGAGDDMVHGCKSSYSSEASTAAAAARASAARVGPSKLTSALKVDMRREGSSSVLPSLEIHCVSFLCILGT